MISYPYHCQSLSSPITVIYFKVCRPNVDQFVPLAVVSPLLLLLMPKFVSTCQSYPPPPVQKYVAALRVCEKISLLGQRTPLKNLGII